MIKTAGVRFLPGFKNSDGNVVYKNNHPRGVISTFAKEQIILKQASTLEHFWMVLTKSKFFADDALRIFFYTIFKPYFWICQSSRFSRPPLVRWLKCFCRSKPSN